MGERADFILSVRVEAQFQQVHHVVQILRPVEFRVVADWQNRAGHFTGDAVILRREERVFIVVGVVDGIRVVAALAEQHVVDVVGVLVGGVHHPANAGAVLGRQSASTALLVVLRLSLDFIRLRQIELVGHDRIATRIFVQAGRAVTDPLAHHEDGHLDVDFDLAHLEGRGVLVAHEVADQATVFTNRLGSGAVGDAGGLDD